jgi:lipopolysaccharide/colanic/teichoic acid biosynthesis glycosyltransferase
MLKRLVDILLSSIGLVVFSPILIPVCITVWLHDFKSPFYTPPRVGKDEKIFTMVKLRSMVVNADKSGVDSTGANDTRITGVGKLIRKCKLDELSQLWNVLIGDMSLVGPRPNVKRETDLYTVEEKKLLSVKPGITDISSIVFADEGDILADSKDPDLDYNQLIRPWKSRLGILYVEKRSLLMDFKLIYLTAVTILSRSKALNGINNILKKLKVDEEMLRVALRNEKLIPTPPPGATQVVTNREGVAV